MADDAGDKTEAPTARRRTEAREQGNIAKSRDLNAAASILAVFFLLNVYGMDLIAALRDLMREMLSDQSFSDLTLANPLGVMLRAIMMVAIPLAPLMLGLVVVVVVANFMQTGLYFSTKRLQPKLSALNPIKGFSRLFSKDQQVIQLGQNLLKLLAVCFFAYGAIRDRMDQIIMVQQLDFFQIFGLGAEIIYQVAIKLGMVLLALSIIDYAWQKYRTERDLKMTKQQVKEEMKRMDGDPIIKRRRREVAHQLAMRRMQQEVPQADVIVTNPTEIAIAIKYDQGRMHAPRVVAKGQGFIAQRIRELAIAHGVPIIERKPLARALYKLVDVGHEIPEQFYSAVAEILAYVYELTGKTRKMNERAA